MTSVAHTLSVTKRPLAGAVLTALGALFLTFDTIIKVLALAHVRLGSPLLSHILFPIYVALLLWGGLYLRETRLRELVPFRR